MDIGLQTSPTQCEAAEGKHIPLILAITNFTAHGTRRFYAVFTRALK
jgi:hypothetical protein